MDRGSDGAQSILSRVADGDAVRVAELLCLADDRCCFAMAGKTVDEAADALVRESVAKSSSAACWYVLAPGGDWAGLVALREPSTASLALRAIGWRSLEVAVAIDPRYRRRGLAAEAIDMVAAEAGRDGVTFALVGCVEDGHVAGHGLLLRCGFEVLGSGRLADRSISVYERAL